MPTTEDIMETFLKHPNAMFVTVPCDATKYINTIIQHLYSDQQPIAALPYDNGAELTDIYPGLCTSHCYNAWPDPRPTRENFLSCVRNDMTNVQG